jgi:hypothetical protein
MISNNIQDFCILIKTFIEIFRFAQNDIFCHPERSEGSFYFISEKLVTSNKLGFANNKRRSTPMYISFFIGLTTLFIFSTYAFAQGPEGVRSPFRLEALVDFPDDALEAVITPSLMDAMMVTLRDMGVTRVSWGYYGDGHGGYMLPSELSDQWSNYAKTLNSLENPLRVAVESAHRHGIELYAYYKPYETGPGISLPDGSPEAKAFGRIRQQGGWLTWMDPFVVDHPNLRIRHKPDDSIKDISKVPICAIKLVKRDDSPTRITKEHLQIWSSQLNYRYQPLNVDFTVQETIEPSPQEVRDLNDVLVTKKGDPIRTLTLSGFRITDPYILVTTDFTDGQSDFENTGTNLLVALDEYGNEIPGVFATGGGVWEANRVDFRNWGLMSRTLQVGRESSPLPVDGTNTSPALSASQSLKFAIFGYHVSKRCLIRVWTVWTSESRTTEHTLTTSKNMDSMT